MPFYRSFYPTFDVANAALPVGVSAIKAQYAAAAAAALPTDAAALASGATTTKISVLGVRTIAAGLAMVKVMSQAPDGRQGVTQMQVPTSAVPPLPRISGFATFPVLAPYLPQVTVVARLAKAVQIVKFSTTSGTFPAGSKLEDPYTGKAYTTDSDVTSSTSGTLSVNVTEVSSTHTGDVTFGSQLVATAPVAGFSPTVTVQQMVGTGGSATAVFTDSTTGATYGTPYPFSLDGTIVAVTGDLSASTAVARTSPTAVPNLQPPKSLSLTSSSVATRLLSPTSKVTAAGTASVKVDDPMFWQDFISYTFKATSAVSGNDSASMLVPFVATFDGAAKVLTDTFGVGSYIDFVYPHAPGLDFPGTVTSIAQSQGYPQPLAPELVGEGLTWAGFVQHEPDGRYSVNIYSSPIGT
jgi:hypothetical protein